MSGWGEYALTEFDAPRRPPVAAADPASFRKRRRDGAIAFAVIYYE
jgi:hypothetical protein